jgi:hypothetical protein
MDQRAGKKEIEGMLLDPFLHARALVTGEVLVDEHAFSERPDFICSREDGSLVGVELAELTFGPHESIDEVQAIELAQHIIARKEASRRSPDWECPDATILVLASARRSIADLEGLLPARIQADFADHGFIEVWFGDYTERDVYGTIELFGLHPPRWWGHHERPNAHEKPYG